MAFRIYQVRTEYTSKGQPCVGNLHIGGDDSFGDFSPLSAQGLADKVGGDSTLMAAWRALLSTGDTVTGVTARELLAPGDTGVPDVGFHAVTGAGTRSLAAGVLPLPVCGLVHVKNNGAVKGGQSWMHLPPIRDAGVLDVGGAISTGSWYQTNAAALITAWVPYLRGGSAWTTFTGIAEGHWGLMTYARKRRARSLPKWAFAVTALQLDLKTHYLRSRRDSSAV